MADSTYKITDWSAITKEVTEVTGNLQDIIADFEMDGWMVVPTTTRNYVADRTTLAMDRNIITIDKI